MGAFSVDNISFSYPSEHGRLSILKDLTFSAARGEFISILGPSGCGKSTLLRLLSGFYSPEKGNIYLNGEQITSPFSQGQMVFQDTGQLLPWLTAEENIVFPRIRSTFSRKRSHLSGEVESHLEDILEKTGLNFFRNYFPAQLSGGLKQRVSLARAIFAEPQILFLDEPFVSLDAPSRYELQKLLINLWQSGGWTVFFVTHDISEALILSEKILIFSGENKNIRSSAAEYSGPPNKEPRILDNNLPYPRDRHSESFRK